MLRIPLRGARPIAPAAVSIAASIALAAMLFRFAAGRQDVLVWCRDFILATFDGTGPVGAVLSAAAILIAGLSSGRLLLFLAVECVRARRLRDDLRARAMPTPGRVLAAASTEGAVGAITVLRDGIPAAFTCGLLRPRIVLTSALVGRLTMAELRAVIAHEARHAMRRDPLRSLLWEAFRRTLFFLPTIGDVAAFAALRREVQADAVAEKRIGRRVLASALLKTVAPQGIPAAIAPFGLLSGRIRALALPAASRSIELSLRRIVVSAAVASAIIAVNVGAVSPARARDGTWPSACAEATPAAMSRINFSPYLRIDLGGPAMSSAVQSLPFAP